MKAPITIIPCCADFGHFKLTTPEKRGCAREELGIPRDAFVVLYQGSIGTWYLFEEMASFFSAVLDRKKNAYFLLITRNWTGENSALISKVGGQFAAVRTRTVCASREEMPSLIACADVMLSFIKPAYSKIASSPTKLAEAYACGVPVIANRGIGDVDEQVSALRAGALIDPRCKREIERVIRQLDDICALGGKGLRERAKEKLDLTVALTSYRRVYDELSVT